MGRRRLRTRWGDAARLELHAALPGTRAVITLPLEAAPGGSQA
jgi:hypothetical protein